MNRRNPEPQMPDIPNQGCEFYHDCFTCPYNPCFQDMETQQDRRAWRRVNKNRIIYEKHKMADADFKDQILADLGNEYGLLLEELREIIKEEKIKNEPILGRRNERIDS